MAHIVHEGVSTGGKIISSLRGDVKNAEGMREASVRGRGIHVRREAQLGDPPQALERGVSNDGQELVGHRDFPEYRIPKVFDSHVKIGRTTY